MCIGVQKANAVAAAQKRGPRGGGRQDGGAFAPRLESKGAVISSQKGRQDKDGFAFSGQTPATPRPDPTRVRDPKTVGAVYRGRQ